MGLVQLGNKMCNERMVDEFHEKIEEFEKEIDRLTKHLHDQMNSTAAGRHGHPDYEYVTVMIGRKTGEDPEDKLIGKNWELNGEGHDSWTRHEYTEFYYFRRLKIDE